MRQEDSVSWTAAGSSEVKKRSDIAEGPEGSTFQSLMMLEGISDNCLSYELSVGSTVSA